jgi:hypothetical protein
MRVETILWMVGAQKKIEGRTGMIQSEDPIFVQNDLRSYRNHQVSSLVENLNKDGAVFSS